MEPSRQVQQYLPGLGSNYKPQVKEPHQMTPDEFDSHPYAVFHASRASAGELAERPFIGTEGWGEHRWRTVQAMHMGTEKSAIERAGSAFYSPDVQDRTSPWKLHTFWAVPRKEELQNGAQYFDDHRVPLSVFNKVQRVERTQKPRISTVGSTEASRSGRSDDPGAYKDDLGYYVNGIEDLGSVSMATHRPDSRYQTHADFVRKAIDSGKGDEVHPLTMAMYKQGKLSQGREITEDEAMHARRTSKAYLAQTDSLDQKYEELERQEGRRRHTTGQAMFDFSDYDNTAGKRGVRGEPDGVARSGYFTLPTEENTHPLGGLEKPGTVYARNPMQADTLMEVTPEPEIPEPTRGPNLSNIRKQRKLDRYKNY